MSNILGYVIVFFCNVLLAAICAFALTYKNNTEES